VPQISGSFRLDAPVERRVPALDGFRGLMTIAVVLSHYFAEIPHGVPALEVGWIAVNAFFALSGYLIANLILDKIGRANFFSVFYIRRFCRTLPSYFLCVTALFVILSTLYDHPWSDAEDWFPLWSYFAMAQNFLMTARASIGPHWLAPTWTLAMEEHFYLLAPALFLLVPRRYLFTALAGCALAAVVVRAAIYATAGEHFGALVLLSSRADVLICGMLIPVAARSWDVEWSRWDGVLRVSPLVAILSALALKLIDQRTGTLLFDIVGPLAVAIGSALYIFNLARGAPEARSCESRVLRFFGSISYCTYLTHLAVLGLMHGLLLGSKPDLTSLSQLEVTIAALPVATFVGWMLTKLVEEPITAYGRSWKWSEVVSKRPKRPSLAMPGAVT
jgi:peptidoglycan/LPS O-acetylase OafA/YrhL